MVKKLFKRFNYGQKGFTLIELLVVVAILGVLAAVAIPNVAKFIGQGQDEAKATELANVQTAVTAGMAEVRVGEIDGATVGPGNGVINADPEIDLNDYLQGGVTKLSRDYIVDHEGTVRPADEDEDEGEGEGGG